MRALRTLLAVGLTAGALASGGRARAQSPAELAAGRQLFVEALGDEEHGRYAEALGKYKRVQLLRDTANIRYRMGSSLEHLGKIAQAVDAYTAAIRLVRESPSGGSTAADVEIVRAAQARLDALGPKVAHVALRLPSPPPGDAEITVDGEPVSAQALPDVPLDPGSHVVAATAKGTRPFRTQINLSEGARVEVPIVLEPVEAVSPVPPAPARRSPYTTIGVVTAGAGGVVLLGGIVVLALRGSAISTLKESCPNGDCPAARQQELTATHDRAKVEGPVGAVLVATGIAAIGAGTAMFLIGRSRTGAEALLVPAPIAHGATVTFSRAF